MKTHQCYSRRWKCCVPDGIQPIYWRSTLFSSWPGTKTLVFPSWSESSCTSPGFSALKHHRIQTDETNYKNIFLQPDHTPSNHPLPMSYTVAVVTILWLFVQTFIQNTRLLSWEFFCGTFRQTRIWNKTALKQTLFDTAPQSRNAHTSMTDRNTFIINESHDSYRKSVTSDG